MFVYAPNPTGWVDPLGLTAGAIGCAVGPIGCGVGIGESLIAALIFGTGATVSGDTPKANTKTDDSPCTSGNCCPPCRTISGKIVKPGVIGYRFDKVPPSTPHYPFLGNHYNLYKANQNPNSCQCFLRTNGVIDASNGKPPPPNSIPIEPFI